MPEEIEQQLKEFAEVSMGTDVGEDDMDNILQLADQVIEITDYRAQLFEYLKVVFKIFFFLILRLNILINVVMS